MDTLWHVLWIMVMIGAAVGGLIVMGYLLLKVLFFLDWMNRGSH